MKSGTYEIVNITNGHRYVGSSVDLSRRWSVHKMKLRSGRHHSPYLQRAWDKHGESLFRFDVLEVCSKESCVALEQRYIDSLRPEYNVAQVAGSRLGVRHTEATKEKMRNAVRRQKPPMSAAHCAAISAAKSGVSNGPISAEHRAKLLAANIGKACSVEKRAKIGSAHLGKKHSLETRAKISAASKGHKQPPLTPDQHRRLCEAQRARRTRQMAELP